MSSIKSEILEKIKDFPITPYLDDICKTLKDSPSHFLILTAETAAGKSTVLPLALLEEFEGRMIITEPRRLAVLGVANRLSDLYEAAGGKNTIGYKIHLESHITEQTRMEVVTEAILVRQLQEDPSLEGYNLVVLDEFHERSVNTDMALAFLKEAMQVRDDLYVIVMSATIETARLQKYLSDAPVMKIPGRQFPVKMIYEPEKSLLSAVYQAIRITDGAAKGQQNILVFLPGISDIRKAQETLLESGDFGPESDIEICVLHSSISLEEQKKVITSGKRRVILSSAIAETSLTVLGVTCVIDSGLARVNRLDLNTGMEKLTTEPESEFSAEQRAGRAGRLAPGTCIRMWAQTDPRVKTLPPEILRTDLVPLVLECSERGVYSADGIDWLDSPTAAAWRSSCALLQTLGMLGGGPARNAAASGCGSTGPAGASAGTARPAASDTPFPASSATGAISSPAGSASSPTARITSRGRAALYLGVHPRLAGIALESWEADVQLGEQARRLLVKFSQYSHSSPELQRRFLADLERRLEKHAAGLRGNAGTTASGTPSPARPTPGTALARGARPSSGTAPAGARLTAGTVEPLTAHSAPLILSGYPDRLAHRLSAPGVEPAEYQFAGGRKALLFAQNAPEWLVAPDVMTTQKGVVIFEFEELSTSKITEFIENHAEIRIICKFSNGKIQKTENKCYGQIVLSSRKLPSTSEDLAEAWLTEIAEKGLSSLPFDKKTESLMLRAEYIIQQNGSPELADKVKSLADSAREWLLPFLGGAKELTSHLLYDALYWYLNGNEIDHLAPEEIILENGRRVRVNYERQAEIRAIVEIIIQRIFGCFKTPEICGKKVLFRLLSPASRPLQVTDDLENFWTGAWPEICKEMKGRYPKHNWNYKIIE